MAVNEQAPLVSVKGATKAWQDYGNGTLKREKSDSVEWAKLDKVMTQLSEAHFQATWQQLLYIPETDHATLEHFFDVNPLLFKHEIPIPQNFTSLFTKSRTLRNGYVAMEPLEQVRLTVYLDVTKMVITDSGIEALLRRTVTSSPEPPLLFENNNIAIDFDLEFKEFKHVIQTCCATMRKPLSYFNRGIFPPRHLLATKLITTNFPRSRLWSTLIFREVHKSLFRDGDTRLRFGPKPNDVFVGLPYVYGWDYGHPSYGNELLSLQDEEITMQLTSMCIRFKMPCNVGGCEFDSILIETYCSNTTAFMVHIWAAKVIAYRTRIDEMACRQMLTSQLK